MGNLALFFSTRFLAHLASHTAQSPRVDLMGVTLAPEQPYGSDHVAQERSYWDPQKGTCDTTR